MSLKTLILLSLLTIFGSPSYAQLSDEEMLDYDTLAAKELLKPITGRIIKVIKSPSGVQFTNVCSGILTENRRVITAAHCFKVKPIFVGWDKVTKRLKQLMATESYYFDIPGVTSNNLYEEALKIAGINKKTGEINIKISKAQGIKLDRLLEKLPKITRALYPRKYLENIPTIIASEIPFEDYMTFIRLRKKYPINYRSSTYDFAIAELDKSIPIQPIAIDSLDSSTVYVGGFFGASLEKPLQVFKCEAGAHVLNDLQNQADMDALNKVREHRDELIFTNCDGEIISGISGGPQVILKNGEILIVGVTSGQLFGTHKFGISPIVNDMVMIPTTNFLGLIPD